MSELSVFESAKQDYEKEIYDLKQEIEYLRSTGSLGILDRKYKELQNINNKQKEVLDKIKEIFKDYGVKEDIVDYSNYYISGESLIHILELLEEIE